tara:strand:+ start:4706 stop:5071 length:366 start_codon:yes stop_codon:yes gene_type:complete
MKETELHKLLVKAIEAKYPDLLFWHTPNGGKRNPREGAKLKAMGTKAGVPDLFFPVPTGKFNGLFIELKGPRGRISDHQKRMMTSLTDQGYRCEVMSDYERTMELIGEYLNGSYARPTKND